MRLPETSPNGFAWFNKDVPLKTGLAKINLGSNSKNNTPLMC